jgi:hypothetical protein
LTQKLTTLQKNYARAMRRDNPRSQMPEGSVWNLLDFIPNRLGAPLRKRGKWTSAATGSGTYAGWVGRPEFTAGAQLAWINDSGTLYNSGSSVGSVGFVPTGSVFFLNKLAMFKSGSTVATYDGSSLSTIATAPTGSFATAYKGRIVVAKDDTVFFGPSTNPYSTSWDSSAFITIDHQITALAALRNAILVFGTGHTTRIRGSVPPPSTIEDMQAEPLFNLGCLDARSLAFRGENVIFANGTGVWMTDGAIPENLIRSGGMASYWLSLMASYTSSWSLTAGIINDVYVLSVMNGSTFVDCLACDVDSRTWFRLGNIKSGFMAQGFGASDELYFARRTAAGVGRLSTIFTPGAGADDDGTAILPVVELPYYSDGASIKTVKALYVAYDIRDAASNNPTLTVSWTTSPESTSYTSLGTLAETTEYGRGRLRPRKPVRGFALKIAQTGQSSDTRLYELQADIQRREESRL